MAVPQQEELVVVTIIALAVAIMGIPVADLQGDWQLREWLVREPGQDTCCGGLAYGPRDVIWQVRGTQVRVSYA